MAGKSFSEFASSDYSSKLGYDNILPSDGEDIGGCNQRDKGGLRNPGRMNKFLETFGKIIFASFGACDVVVKVTTPIVLSVLWIKLIDTPDWGSYLFLGVGLLASIFRASKFWLSFTEDE